jgi:WhiB family transcriptional regulator, redox-sensing transcriptional regulator
MWKREPLKAPSASRAKPSAPVPGSVDQMTKSKGNGHVTIGQQLKTRAITRPDVMWRDQAHCRFSNLNLFFPVGSDGAALEQIEAAKAICQRCRVRDCCLLFALETNQEDGIWGGTTEAERRKLRRSWLVTRRHHSQAHQ